VSAMCKCPLTPPLGIKICHDVCLLYDVFMHAFNQCDQQSGVFCVWLVTIAASQQSHVGIVKNHFCTQYCFLSTLAHEAAPLCTCLCNLVLSLS